MAKAPDWLPKLRATRAEADALAAADAEQRKAAGKHPKSVILTAKDVQEGKYDIGRLLQTTLGMGKGERTLTHDDLATFRHNAEQVRRRYTGGIRARQVLDFSLSIDRQRATEQIHHAVAVSSHGARVRFMTNAWEESDAKYHYQTVEFLDYSALAAGSAGDAKVAALRMRRGPLKIECDCGRWRFWYRYVATIGKYNAGRDETGYPKIRNSSLRGIACKHLLRVMHEVESSPSVLAYLERMIRTARDQDDNQATIKITQAEAAKLAQQRSGDVREADNAAQRAARRVREKAAIVRAFLALKLPMPKAAAPATRAAPKDPGALARRFGMAIDRVKGLFK